MKNPLWRNSSRLLMMQATMAYATMAHATLFPLYAWAQTVPAQIPAPSKQVLDPKVQAMIDDFMSDDPLVKSHNFGKKTLADYNQDVAASPKDSKVYEKRGYYYWGISNYDKALADYEKAIQLDPRSVSCHLQMARIYREKKDSVKALAHYDKAVELDILGESALSGRASYYVELKQFDKALADYNTMVLFNTKSDLGYQERSNLLLSLKQFERALPDLQVLVERNPKSVYRLVSLAEALRELRRTDEAIAILIKAQGIDPKSGQVLDQLGVTYGQTKSYDLAMEKFAQALAIDEEMDIVYLHRAQMLFDQGKRSSALEDLDKIIALNDKRKQKQSDFLLVTFKDMFNQMQDRDMAQVYFYRSLIKARNISLGTPEVEKAPIIADASQAVKLDPDLAQEYIARGRILMANSSAKYGLVPLLMGASTALPRDVATLVGLGEAQCDALESKNGITTFSRALVIDPQSTAALRGRAMAYARSARPYEAAEWAPAVGDWKSYLKLKPTDAEGLRQLGMAQYNAGQAPAGIATFENILKADPENAYAHLMLGLGLALNGDADGAEAQVKTYMFKLKAGEMEMAQSAFGNAKTQNPTIPALKKLYDLLPESQGDDDGAAIIPFLI